ncbi:hypothetical protein ACFQZJ_16180 [Maribacter chungangensis]|uniref:Uncharacterized protein n=1 Tax=Maribacter chungangensis TaxID=1069117 RepID=A0ABW3B6U6_9FLAO
MKSILLFCLLTTCSISISNGQKLLAEIGSERNVYIIYYGQTPTFEYDSVTTVHKGGGIDKGWKSSVMIDKILKKMSKNKIKGDAIMFTSENMTDAQVINFKKNDLTKPSVELEKIENINLIYLEQRPLFEMEYVIAVESPKFIKNWRTKTLKKIMLKKALGQQKKFNILHFKEDDLWQADLYITK